MVTVAATDLFAQGRRSASLTIQKEIDMVHRLATLRARHSDRGATAVEYALMVMLIALVIIAAVMGIGTTLTSIFTGAATRI
jgi:pilus assembly protein Flp/PilA